MSLDSSISEIAIVGMSVLFPGAKDLTAYWHNIINRVDCLREAPDDWASPYYDPTQAETQIDSARIYTRKVGLIGDLAEFNPLEFGIPPKAVEGDPAHFLALKLARDALQDANYLERSFNHETTGIVIGRGAMPNRGDTIGMQYGLVMDQTLHLLKQLHPQLSSGDLKQLREELKASLPPMAIEQAPSLVSNVVTGRIANRLNLMGPNYLVDAACSSSLIAVAHAIDELVDHRSDMMLAGGLQGSMPPQIYMLFCQLHALSKGDLRPFDAAASGTLLSEGLGFVVLKRLADAERDGDRIYAVIKGVGISSDGKAQGLLAPRPEGQILALRRAYAQTGIDPHTISLIEAHGTGIPLGDRTELGTLTTIFGQRQGNLPDCALGSVKSMIGHSIPASGIASLAKTALALYYKTLPPTLCDRVNPELAIEQTPFYINTQTRPWIHPANAPRRAAINAFGFGGINAHAILEEYGSRPDPASLVWQSPAAPEPVAPESGAPQPIEPQPVWFEWPTELLVLAAPSRAALLEQVQQVQAILAGRPDISLAAIVCTLAQNTCGAYRLALLANSRDEAHTKLEKAKAKLTAASEHQWQLKGGIAYAEEVEYRPSALMFSTEGAQYPHMLADLCLYFPQARAWFDFLDETFDRCDRPSQIIFPAPTGLTHEQQTWASQQLFAADVATETLSTASLAIYEILKDFGLSCDVMVGHSAGEHVAMRAAGLAKFESRSHLKQELQRLNQVYHDLETRQAVPTGVLLSIGAVEFSAVEALLATYPDACHLVAHNCPNQVLVFAQPDHQTTVIEFVKAAGGICTLLPFDRAYHTPLFAEGTRALRAYYEGIELGDCTIPVYSCATVAPYPNRPDAIRDLSAQQWSLPVRFHETLECLYDTGIRTFIEVGANSNLTNFAENIFKGRDCLVLPTNTPRRSALAQLLQVIGRLWVQGATLDFSPLYRYRPLPTVDWQHVESPAQPFTLRLNMLLPQMQLRPNFTAAQFSPPEPSPGSTVVADTTAPGPVQPSPVPESASTSTPNDVVYDSFFQADPLPRQELVAAHFSLMQAFLDHQSRVSSQVFHRLTPPQSPPRDS